ncbi:MFS transporter [Agromyces subbeticus]|uniref:MFS transporter n=1 Tax=Agromyces subbeticus TaxID=293890 RepID=UPI0003B43EAE|nr:MFS transporter [Agromyces subbeticus]
MSTEPPSYRAVLRTEHIARAFLPSIIGRLSLSTSGLALVLLLERATGSFAIAGAVTATLGIANVVVTPWRARLIDRRGQALVLTSLGLLHASSLVALGLAPHAGLPILLCLSVIAGASSPPFAASMRVLWSAALPPGGLRVRGLSLDAVAGEVTFAVGPLVAALLAVIIDPLAALLLSAGCVLAGAALFVSSPLSRRQRGSRAVERAEPVGLSPLRSRGFPPMVLAMVVPGLVLGIVEIAAPALAVTESNTVLAGVLLALFAGASAVSGLLYGRVHVRPAVERQLIVLSLALLAVLAVTGLVGGSIAALIGFTLGGLCLAPVLIVGYLAADSRTDPRVRTEANGWIDTAVNLGAALGAAVFGALADTAGPGHALAISTIIGVVVIALCAPFLLRSRNTRS